MEEKTQIKAFPTSLKGTLDVPTSKSLTHRALIAAALSKGTSIINNVLFSADILATIDALKQIGAKIEVTNNQVKVTGVKHLKTPNEPINCNESGSTLRFLIPILALTDNEVIFTGEPSLLSRPQTIYQTIAEQDGILFNHSADKIVVNGSFKGKRYTINGSISSQFFTGFMFALPLIKSDTYLIIDGELESKSYVDLTIEILRQFNIEIQELENGYFIEGNQTYKPTNYTVEGDFSQASFFLVGAILNGSITLDNLSHESLQGDREIIDIIKQMRGQIIYTENGYIANKSDTYGTTIDITNCPDLGPIVALLGCFSKGTTRITGATRLRLKESDRIESTVTTLQALGASIKTEQDDIVIYGKKLLHGGTVDSFNDHRIAMMAAMAALRCKNPVTINRANAVNKSYPHFFKDYKKVGGIIQ
jgi:3-phosphoshikimate 1-carboxyvinyltransferase